jgi:hypothetical protein
MDGQKEYTVKLRKFSRIPVILIYGFLIGTGLLSSEFLDMKKLWRESPIKVVSSFGLGVLLTSFIYITEIGNKNEKNNNSGTSPRVPVKL